MANSVDPDQTAPILNPSVMLGSYLQQMTSDDFQMYFLLGPLINGDVGPKSFTIRGHTTMFLKGSVYR